MPTISLARTSRAEVGIIGVHTTRFGAKSSPTGANYALHQAAKDNAVIDESLVKTVKRKFCKDDFLKAVRTPQEAIKIYGKSETYSAKVDLN